MVSGIRWILNNMRFFCCQVYIEQKDSLQFSNNNGGLGVLLTVKIAFI